MSKICCIFAENLHNITNMLPLRQQKINGSPMSISEEIKGIKNLIQSDNLEDVLLGFGLIKNASWYAKLKQKCMHDPLNVGMFKSMEAVFNVVDEVSKNPVNMKKYWKDIKDSFYWPAAFLVLEKAEQIFPNR